MYAVVGALGAVLCAAIYATAKLVALLIVLRGSKPNERATLVRAVAELFRTRPWPPAHPPRRPASARRADEPRQLTSTPDPPPDP